MAASGAQTGNWFSPSYSGSDRSNTNTVGGIPNRICDGNLPSGQRTVSHWFDTSCFVKPAPNYFGDSGTNIITGPGINNWDLGLGKVFPIREAMNVQFRTELFNAFNHTQFLNPDSTMTDANFGRITTARPARELQFGLKLLF